MEGEGSAVDAQAAANPTTTMTNAAKDPEHLTASSVASPIPPEVNAPSLVRMNGTPRFHPVRLWRDYGVRLMRYGGVTLISSAVGLTTFAIGVIVFDWPAVFANFVSVLFSTPPAYLLNRHWVWERDPGGHSVSSEIGPFWILTLLGWLVSTIAVGTVAAMIDDDTLVNDMILIATQVAAFGSLWLVKFAFLEKVMWRHQHRPAQVAEKV